MKPAAPLPYPAAIQYLYGLQLFGANLGLDRTRRLAQKAGHPQDRLRFIHVAGTNGKGSTCALLESIYRAAGQRVGLFTSPHLVSFRERLQINRQLISEPDLVGLVEAAQGWLADFPKTDHPTMFEVVTVMALKYFADQKCDLVIWETGLGGRLDATNIVTPLASVITNIGLDHTQWLGNTLGAIAAEKAGIIKLGVPVITAETQPEPAQVIAATAQRLGAPLIQATTPTYLAQACPPALAPSLRGHHQLLNTATAVATVATLQKLIPVGENDLRRGIRNVYWPGRLQRLTWQGQNFLLDGAHNQAGIATLCAELASQPTPPAKRHLIIGVLADKEWQPMCRQLAPFFGQVIAVPVASSRTATPAEIAAEFQHTNPAARVLTAGDLAEALGKYATVTGAERPAEVVIAGSLYLIGEALGRLDPRFAGSADEGGLNEWTGTVKPKS
ncbi:MAG TPA: folylpolyglutamate synthase/dihydrofolate synthase family protein [Verrucomicrobiae bacterium]